MRSRVGHPLTAFALLVTLAGLGGCASGPGGPPPSEERSGSSPRVRCLSDPRGDTAAGNRPILFLFCTESP